MMEMHATARWFLALGASNAMLAVILGAFGAHALKNRLDEGMLAIYQTGNDYHFYHALGLIFIGIISILIPTTIWIKISGWTMLSGIFLFCVSLYCLSIYNVRWLGMITPFGGLLFIIAWATLCIAVFNAE